MVSEKQKLATLCYIMVNNKLLLLHRVKKSNDMHQDKYIGLGGKIDPYESPRECIMREIYEEAGIRPLDLTFKSMIYFKEQNNTNLNRALNYLVFVYRATKFKGTLLKNPPEGEFIWATLEEFNSLNIWEGDKIFVPKLFSDDRFFEAIFEYTPDEKLIKYELKEV